MAAISMDKEVRKVAEKFEDEFEFNKMETMIHRFPAELRAEMRKSYPHMVAPRFVAIGPYHHGMKHLEKMEEVKKAAAYYLCQRVGVTAEQAMKAVLQVVDEARSKYYDKTAVDVEGEAAGTGGTGGTLNLKDDTCFAAMMVRDACFLLLYMDAYNRSHSDKEDHVVHSSMRRFLFSNRERINSDIMLLENQIPWLVIQALVELAASKSPKHKEGLYRAVATFIAGMRNSFKITVSLQPKKKNTVSCADLAAAPAPRVWEEYETDPPAHLLALLRRHKIESESIAANNTSNHLPPATANAPPPSTDLNSPLLPTSAPRPPPPSTDLHHRPLIIPTSSTLHATSVVSSMSPVNLREIGIKLMASKTAAFSDMRLDPGWVHGHLTLAPLSLSDTRASWLVNMAALEACTETRFRDHADRTAVCSYLALFAFFMVGAEDVRRLRSMSLLHGRPHGDGDMLAFFDAVTKHLPVGRHFANLMKHIADYKEQRPIRTTLYRWVYNNYKTIMAVVSVILTLISLYQALHNLIPSN